MVSVTAPPADALTSFGPDADRRGAVHARPAGRPRTTRWPSPTANILTDFLGSLPRAAALEPQDVKRLTRAIEAGVLAREQLETSCYSTDASEEELRVIAAEGQEALRTLVHRNVRLALSVARPHLQTVQPSHAMDLVQSALYGLVLAIQRYDVQRGHRFSTYATWWIRHAVGEELNRLRDIHIGPEMVLRLRRVARFRGEWRQLTGRDPANEDIASEFGLNAQQMRNMRLAERNVLRLDAPLTPDGEQSLGDLIADPNSDCVDDAVICEERRRTVHWALSALTDEEKRFVEARFGLNGEPMSQRQVAVRSGVSIPYARALEQRALAALRAKLAAFEPQDLLG